METQGHICPHRQHGAHFLLLHFCNSIAVCMIIVVYNITGHSIIIEDQPYVEYNGVRHYKYIGILNIMYCVWWRQTHAFCYQLRHCIRTIQQFFILYTQSRPVYPGDSLLFALQKQRVIKNIQFKLL